MEVLANRDDSMDSHICNFLYLEAEALDDRRFREWLDSFVDEEIHYIVPLRLTRMATDGPGFEKAESFQDDNFPALRMRVNRLDSKASWSEHPPTRVRHHISNVRVGRKSTINGDPNNFQVDVKSNVLIFRTRGESPHFDLLSGERRDTLRHVSGKFKLLKREVLLDHTTIGTHNFAFIF
ncbi:MAG: aromatic-ring-hydroxylating dioxygenase subunit beta [Bradyrhizobium sp.]|uniref:aromatic-ring-hydroxylating dioxygenase subunit beta n=1 Tax=Bradyrhizobium sp. TaxID=376 RepID=UPI0029AAAB68|nr:aromatic-ring-hydroxylating dioxygenase subunit beta [Bradyrhizobium sp.]MDX3969230.1 aromatic-ring-hydroxylating dioxygenase subunit beta [Bradyrhizobium sp.]